MAIAAFLCIFIGSYTPYLYSKLPLQTVEYHPYTTFHVMETLQVLLFTALGFFLMLALFAVGSIVLPAIDWVALIPERIPKVSGTRDRIKSIQARI